ncbi:MAG: signal peptidase I [Clostridia bacterium]|nr:signal peptidase I [Clostridia bacterium]
MKKNKKKFPSALRLILLIICGAALGINVYLANAKSLVGNQMPMPFGYGASVVLSGSMEPEFSKGDLIVVAESDSYQKRDIVVFQDGASLVVHRIIDIDGDKIITQGDANATADEPIEASVIKGKVLFHIDNLGTVASFFKTPVGTVLLVVLAIALVEIPRRREKEADDEEKQKILEEIKRLREESLKDSETKD